jgi:HSP20 family protein
MAFGLAPFDPVRELDRLERAMRRGFEGAFGRFGETMPTPAVEVTDEGDHYLVRCEVPGVPEDAVDITLTGNVLSLRGEKRLEKQATPGGTGEAKETQGENQGEAAQRSRPLYSEVYYGSFERVLTLPDDIDAEKVQANAKNGVLNIQIGKKTQGRAKKIEVTRH